MTNFLTLKYYVGRHVSSSNPHTPMVHVASGILHVPVCGQDPSPHCSHPFLPATILRAIFEDLSCISYLKERRCHRQAIIL